MSVFILTVVVTLSRLAGVKCPYLAADVASLPGVLLCLFVPMKNFLLYMLICEIVYLPMCVCVLAFLYRDNCLH